MKKIQLIKFISRLKSAYKETFNENYFTDQQCLRKAKSIIDELMDFPLEKRLDILNSINFKTLERTKKELQSIINNNNEIIKQNTIQNEKITQIYNSIT